MKQYDSTGDVRREIRRRVEHIQSPFWGLVSLAEEVHLPKPHLTQPDLVAQIETEMGEFDEAGRASAFRQVLTGVVEGRFSQYAVLPFGHFATSSFKDDNGEDRTRNRAPEARRLMTVIDAVIEEMPENSEYKQRNAAYSEALESLHDEESGKVNDDQLRDLIIGADKAGEPFWTDSTEFIHDGVVEGSAMTLTDLAVAGVISVQETGGGGSKAFIAGGKYLPTAIDKLAEAGFEDAAELLRSRTQRRQSKSTSKLGSGISALAGLGPTKTDDETTTTEADVTAEVSDGYVPSEKSKAEAEELKTKIFGSKTATEKVEEA